MTHKQFKFALLRGQGRCIQAVQVAPDKYYDLILWSCSHELSFDTQCEGSRAWFVYQLINCYKNKNPFLETAIRSLECTKSDEGWKILYLEELLNYFSDDGEQAATQALWCKYEKLYAELLKKRCRPKGLFSLRDDFEQLCQILAKNKAAFLKIAADVGRLYQEKSFYTGADFEWLYESKGRVYLSALVKWAEKSDAIAEYLRIGQEYEQEFQNRKKSAPQNRPVKGIALSLRLKKNADKGTILQYAKAYLEQSAPGARAEALTAFCQCPYPEDPAPIIKDTQSNCEMLKEKAWQALSHIRHPLVRIFAIENLENYIQVALPVFIKNYQCQDAALLESLVRTIAIDFDDTTGWHGIHLDVLRLKDDGINVPAVLLHYIYENTFCSCCRESVLRQMGKRRMLTNEILQECLLDSNADIRIYAKRCLNRRAGLDNKNVASKM